MCVDLVNICPCAGVVMESESVTASTCVSVAEARLMKSVHSSHHLTVQQHQA